MEPIDQKAINETIVKTITENLPSVVDAVVTEKLANFETKTWKDLDEVKAAIKEMSINKKFDTHAKEIFAKTAIVAIVKDVMTNNVNSEKGFKDVVDTHVKAMSEAANGDGAELVFDQFEQSVQMVINTFEIASLVKIIPIAKGDKLNLPKVTNGVTTAYITELNAPTDSDLATAFVAIDIYKTMTLTNFSDELLEDTMTIPDLYDMIVQNVAESQGAFLEKQILAGTGSNAVEGILVNAQVNSLSLAATKRAGDISDTDIVNVYAKALMKFKRNRAGLRWVTSQYVLAKLQALKTTDGYPLYAELRGANPTLMGHPVIITDDSSIAQDSGTDIATKPTIIFGDFSYFILVRRKGMTLERGYYGSNWTSNIQSLKSIQRYGGKCTFGEAFTKLLNGAT